ncbi:MAG: hypothetical protein KDD70_11955, partial [Bdellovibrionales bacterium]|nr:hypothetical protein [Bdellovibrionales bacterium]
MFRSYSVPAFWKERVYIGFAFSGLVLAVSLFTSVLLANRVVLREFREAVDGISGSSSYQIVPRSEYLAASTVLPLLHREPSVRVVFPIRKERIDVELEGERLSVMLVGIDVLNEHLAEVVGGSSGSPTDTGLRGLLTYGEVLVS